MELLQKKVQKVGISIKITTVKTELIKSDFCCPSNPLHSE